MEFNDELDYHEGYECTDLRNEPRPDSVVYHQQFAELKKFTHKAASMLLRPLKESHYHNAVTKGLLNEVETRMHSECSDEVKFAVAGDMAAGKSSVINSILSIGTIARKGDCGGSCTWVVQRFMKSFPDQGSPFAARVHFFGIEEIRAILKSLLQKYYSAAGLDRNDSDEDDEKEDQVEDYNDMRTVLDTLMALYSGREDFGTEDKAKAYLKESLDEDLDEVVEHLVSGAEEVMSQHLEGQSFVSVNASTPGELLFYLQPYTYTLGGDDGRGVCSPWPLVSVIDFGLDVPLLNEGIIFIDSPGLSDANSTRATNAALYHKQCTHKITVAEIRRAKDDKTLRESLSLGYSTRGSGNTILVLTRGDSIDSDTEVTGSAMEKKREHALRDQIKNLNAERQTLNIKRQKMEREDRFGHDEQIRGLSGEVQRMMDDLDALRIRMRNRNVADAVQKQYKDLTGDPKPLACFCVGNEAYKQYVAGFSEKDRPVIDVMQTGIPALRRRIFLLPAEGKLNDAVHLATTQLPSLVNSFELYCAKTHMARKNEIEAIILRPNEYFRVHAKNTLEKQLLQVKCHLLSPLKFDEAKGTQEARTLCRNWSSRLAKGHLQILKKHGMEKGSKKSGGDVNWNAELVAIHKQRVEEYFRNLHTALVPQEEEFKSNVGRILDRTRSSIRDDPQFNLMALDTFLKNFSLERPNAMKRVTSAFRDMTRAMSNIQESLLTSSGDSYLSQAMVPIYVEICKIKGRGGPQKRIEAFEKKVSKIGGVWTDVHDRFDAAFDEVFKNHLRCLTVELEGVIGDIHRKFLMLCADTEVKDESEKEQEEELR